MSKSTINEAPIRKKDLPPHDHAKYVTKKALAVLSAFVYNRYGTLNDKLKQAKAETKDLQKQLKDLSGTHKEEITKTTNDFKKLVDGLEQKLKDQTQEKDLNKDQLEKVRKMIRFEVGRILFDIYKLRNSWGT